jgi:hypothetical protein
VLSPSLFVEQSTTCGVEAMQMALGSIFSSLLGACYVFACLFSQSSSFNHVGGFHTFYHVLSVRRQGLPYDFGNIQYINMSHRSRAPLSFRAGL